MREALKLVVKNLILQEVRVIQLEQSSSPSFVLDQISRSIDEVKREVIDLVRWIPAGERETLLRKVIRQSVDEEIDQAIRVRQKRCFRCIHVRYFDQEGAPHSSFPVGAERAQVIGCHVISSPSDRECESFVESPLASSLEDYLDEMSILFEVKEMFDEFERIWEGYLTK